MSDPSTGAALAEQRAAEPTDEQLQAQLRKAREKCGLPQNSVTRLGDLRVLPPSLTTGRCIRCQKELPAERAIQCDDCDAAVEKYWLARNLRDAAESLETRLKMSRLPKRFTDGTVTWANISRQLGDLAACADVLRVGRGLFLWGRAGTFKTSFAAAYVAEAIRNGASGRYVYVPDLFTELAEIYAADDARSRADVIDRYAMAQWLVLDDIDKAKPSRHSAEVLLAILDYRYREGERCLFVTSNEPVDKLVEAFVREVGENFAEPLVRRLAELCVGVPMGGIS